MSESFWESLALLAKLHGLIDAGRCDEAEAEQIGDRLGELDARMSARERGRLDELALTLDGYFRRDNPELARALAQAARDRRRISAGEGTP